METNQTQQKSLDHQKLIKELEKTVLNFWRINKISRKSMSKGQSDIVTETDLAMEKEIINLLNNLAPNIPILSEETLSETTQEGTFFSIDPVDGTWNFSHNVPVYGTQVALLENNFPVAGLIYLPNFNFMFTAIKDKGAYLNDLPIYTKDYDFQHSLIAVTDLRKNDSIDMLLNLEKVVAFDYGKARMNGCSSYDLAMVAMGAYQGKVAITPKLWDVAPGLIIVKEAGGSVAITKEYTIAASSEKMLDALIKTYKKVKEFTENPKNAFVQI